MAKKAKIWFYKTNDLMRDIVTICRKADESKISFSIGTSEERPIYLLSGASIVSALDLLLAVPIDLDDMRRHWTDIRALIRLDNMKFVFVSKKKKLAILSRHPAYKAVTIEKYRACAKENFKLIELIKQQKKA